LDVGCDLNEFAVLGHLDSEMSKIVSPDLSEAITLVGEAN
jgi:hypothetical protein